MDKKASSITVVARSENTVSPIVFINGESRIEMFCTASGITTTAQLYAKVVEDGGSIERWIDENGVLYIKAVAKDGYAFDGYYVDGKKIESTNYNFDDSVTVELKFSSNK